MQRCWDQGAVRSGGAVPAQQCCSAGWQVWEHERAPGGASAPPTLTLPSPHPPRLVLSQVGRIIRLNHTATLLPPQLQGRVPPVSLGCAGMTVLGGGWVGGWAGV